MFCLGQVHFGFLAAIWAGIWVHSVAEFNQVLNLKQDAVIVGQGSGPQGSWGGSLQSSRKGGINTFQSSFGRDAALVALVDCLKRETEMKVCTF